MYSGITQGLYPVMAVIKKPGILHYTVQLSPALSQDLRAGDSVSVDGVCQTVVSINGTDVSFQAIQETLEKTTLHALHIGDTVSIERSVRYGDEIGGHEIAGHVIGTAVIQQKIVDTHNTTLVIRCNPAWMKYILPKGFIAVDGSSLTVGKTDPQKGEFYLHLIPETLRLTHFGRKQVQDSVNIECDYKAKVIVDTVERILSSKKWQQPDH